MKATETPHRAGQSLWLDNITRTPLTSVTLRCYIEELSITGSPRTRRSSITRSGTARPMMQPFASAWLAAARAKACSSRSRSRISFRRRICFGPSISAPSESAAGSHSRSPRSRRTTHERRLPRRRSLAETHQHFTEKAGCYGGFDEPYPQPSGFRTLSSLNHTHGPIARFQQGSGFVSRSLPVSAAAASASPLDGHHEHVKKRAAVRGSRCRVCSQSHAGAVWEHLQTNLC